MALDESRPSFFTYKVLEDSAILERQSDSRQCCEACHNCCSTLPRCLSFFSFLLSFTVSIILTMGPWALAFTEIVIQTTLYLLVVCKGHWRHLHIHYSWWSSEEDVVIFSYIRCLVGLAALCFGFGKRKHRPYLVAACLLSTLGILFIGIKAVLLRHKLVSKWGALLLSSVIFSIVHVIVALNVRLFTRMRYNVRATLADDEEQPEQPLASTSAALHEENLTDGFSRFVECSGVRVHYKIATPEGRKQGPSCIVLIHGFGGGSFSWRHVMQQLAKDTGLPVIAFDRPGSGLTSRPILSQEERHSIMNPYQMPFQTILVLKLCELWGCQSVILVGHSDGALLALHIAAQLQRHKLQVERKSLEARVRQSSELCTGEADHNRDSVAADKESLAYSPPYREAGLQVPEKAENGSSSSLPSSPFSKWLQLGQPSRADSLQARLEEAGCSPPAPLSRVPSSSRSEDLISPSFALDEVSALLGPERARFTGISSNANAHQGNGGQVEQYKGRVTVCGLVLLNPLFQGESKPEVARIMSSTRMGRQILKRILCNEVGEIRNGRAWFDVKKLTLEVLAVYKRPLQLKDAAQGTVEATRIRTEKTQEEVMADFETLEYLPKLFMTGETDHLAPSSDMLKFVTKKGTHCKLGIVAECGHFTIEEQPEQVVHQISDFLNKAGMI